MAGKIKLTLAVSIDGFIADEDGGFDWIKGQGDRRLDTDSENHFAAFLKDIDIVVMGNACYRQGLAADFGNKRVFVATHTRQADHKNITFIGGDIVNRVCKERDAGNNIYLFGGGVLIDPFIKANVIDTYEIGVIPIILGKGRPLFLQGNPAIELHLESYSLQDGTMELRYTKRNA